MGEAEYIRGFLILSAGIILFYIVLEYFKDQNNIEEEDTFTNFVSDIQCPTRLVANEDPNLKITYPEDIALAEKMIS